MKDIRYDTILIAKKLGVKKTSEDNNHPIIKKFYEFKKRNNKK